MAGRKLIFLGLLTAIAASGVYACSSDDTTATPVTTTDAGGGSDSGSTGDTGTKGDSGGTDGSTTTKKAHVTITGVNGNTISGTGTFTEANGAVTLTVNVMGAPPGPRGTHVHVNADCSGGHYNPDTTTKNGEFDNTVVNDAGVGTGTSTRQGISLDAKSDAGTGIVGRALAIHGIAPTDVDGGPLLDDAGAPVKPPVIGCGEIMAN